MFFFLSFNKCWPTLFLAHFIILEVQLSESSFHILLYLFILLNSILFFTLPWKRWKNWIHDRSCIFDAKTKNFLSLNEYWISYYPLFSSHLLGFFWWIQNYNCWTVYCDFVLFFSMSSKTYSAVFVRNFLLLCYFWMITWLLMTFVDLFPLFLFLSLDLIFFSSSLFARIFRYPSFSQSTLFPRQVPFGDYLLMFLLTTFFLHKSSQSSVNK